MDEGKDRFMMGFIHGTKALRMFQYVLGFCIGAGLFMFFWPLFWYSVGYWRY